MDNNYYDYRILRKKIVDESEKKYLEESKNRLKTIVCKKMKTCFIGVLAHIEDYFGFLWGMDDVEITDRDRKLLKLLRDNGFDEAYFDDLWNRARNDILHKGNNQVRAIEKELEQYTIRWDRYNLVFIMQKDNKDE